MKSINLIILDDHSVILEGLKSVFQKVSQIHLSNCFNNHRDLFYFLENEEADILMLDIEMPSMNGLEVLNQLKVLNNNIKRVIFTQHEGEYYFKEATQLGVHGYILKSESIYTIPEILLRIQKGEYYISKNLTHYLKPVRSSVTLNALEHSIIKYIIEGKSIKEISVILDKSEKVIEYRLSKIRSIFDAKTNGELGYKIREQYYR